jgi:uncharacterized protein (TIGR02270 family)
MTGFGPIQTIVDQHCEEAAFLWSQRARAVKSASRRLKDICALDSRLEAHLDGLRVAGQVGWELSREALELDGQGELFVASVLAFESGDPQRIQAVLSQATSSLARVRAAISALGWLSSAQARIYIDHLLASSDLIAHRAGVAAAAIHRLPLPSLASEIRHTASFVRSRAYRAAGELGIPIDPDINEEDESCRFWAAWTGLRNGDNRAIHILKSFGVGDGPFAQAAVNAVMCVMAPTSILPFFHELQATRVAVTASGALGAPQLVPWLLAKMAEPTLSRAAAEAFSAITGADMVSDQLEGEKPEVEPGPSDNSDDEIVAMDPDEGLPWPDPVAVERWWAAHQDRFTADLRYVQGKPITTDSLVHVLWTARQPQRVGAALQLALRNPGQSMFNVESPGYRQRQLLAFGP